MKRRDETAGGVSSIAPMIPMIAVIVGGQVAKRTMPRWRVLALTRTYVSGLALSIALRGVAGRCGPA